MADKPPLQSSSKTSLVSTARGRLSILPEAELLMAYAKSQLDHPKPISASYKKLLLSDMQSMHLQTNFSAPAFSPDTLSMEKHLSDLKLRIPPSPGSLPVLAEQRPLAERLFDATANVKILTAQVAMHMEREWRDKIFSQLDSLHNPKEWEEGDEPVRQASFATFLKAIVQIRPSRRPGLGLSYGGHLVAAWTNGENRLTVEFLENDRVLWVIGRRVDDDPEQIAGQTTVSRLASSLAPYEPGIWFSA